MPYLLHINVSPLVESSTSRKVSAAFVEAYKSTHPESTVVERDLAVNPPPHLDAEAISAGFVAESDRSPSMAAKHQARLDLIKEIKEAEAVVIATPMYNWSIPSTLKAYIDQIVMPGVFDSQGQQGLAGKPVTIIYATGGGYSDDEKSAADFVSKYLKSLAKLLGATDVELIRAELQLAGVFPGMESLVEAKVASTAAALKSATARSAAPVAASTTPVAAAREPAGASTSAVELNEKKEQKGESKGCGCIIA